MQLRFEQKIDLPRADLFAFHEDPEHLVLLHRGWAAFRMLHHAGNLYPGSRIWFEMTMAGIVPVALGFEHTIYEPPVRFGERLIHGPFRRFVHVHEFEEVNGGTIARDLLEIELPWYYGGELAMKFFVAPQLRRAFRFRGRALRELVQAGDFIPSAGPTVP